MSGCPTCSGPSRETVGLVCQTCGTDYGTPEPDAWISDGDVYLNMRKHPVLLAAYDPDGSCTPLWFTTTPAATRAAHDGNEEDS
jgi:hypothetical protein